MFFSEKRNQFKSFSRRSVLILLLKMGLLSSIVYKLYDIQILNSKKYKTLSENNRINLKVINPTRGLIYDRNNKIVATNYVTYELFIIPEQVDDIGLVFKNLSKIIEIPFKQRKKVLKLSKQLREFEMIKITDNLSWSQLEKIELNLLELPGVHLLPYNKRYYPQSHYFSHIVGYTSQPSEKDMELPYISSMPTLEIGKTGVEKFFNKQLIGIPGRREVEVSSIGKEIREVSRIESKKGNEIKISLDLDLQKIIYEQIKNKKSASVVVMNVNSGEIVGMLSVPNYDPNKLINKPNAEYWKNILENTLAPLTNRAIQGLYAPGSTFKIVVALAALEKKLINKDTEFYCNGKIEFGDRIFHCWKTEGHGKVNLIKGIKESCDCYFYEVSNIVGVDNISKMAKKFGFGETTKIELPSENIGIVPSKKWKKDNLKENWYKGETLIFGIGQGYILSTPLQLAKMTSIIANGGYEVNPTLLTKKDLNTKDKNIGLNSENIKLIRDAMKKVVNEVYGTAFSSRSNPDNYIFSGKTGTSQVKKITIEERESDDFRKKEIEWKNKDHALFVGYMPSEEPKYSISIIVEHGGSGSSTAAPIAKEIFNAIHRLRI